ncbi:UNVERIFIED_CONTAM: hypothetical protein HDU68_008479 [Siphonaria sp. JEL0065]|nr:hypothetical protein HDU68_008479 [Siphonaria sp. JEL0065]
MSLDNLSASVRSSIWYYIYKVQGNFGQEVCMYVFYVAGGLTLLTTGFVIYFVLVYKFPKEKTIITPFNISLIGGLMAFLCEDICQAVRQSARLHHHFENHMESPMSILIALFQTTGELFYLKYSWARSERQVQAVFPHSCKFWKFMLKWSPLDLYSQLIAPIGTVWIGDDGASWIVYVDLITQLAGVVVVFVLDAIFFICFVKYLARTKAHHTESADPRFVIISTYGLIAASLFFCNLTLWTFYTIVKLGNSFNGIWLDKVEILRASYVLLMSIIFMVLSGMKVALYNHSMKEEACDGVTIRKRNLNSWPTPDSNVVRLSSNTLLNTLEVKESV